MLRGKDIEFSPPGVGVASTCVFWLERAPSAAQWHEKFILVDFDTVRERPTREELESWTYIPLQWDMGDSSGVGLNKVLERKTGCFGIWSA